MSPLKTVLVAALTAGVFVSIWQYQQRRDHRLEAARLHRAIDEMREQASQHNRSPTRQAPVAPTMSGVRTVTSEISDGPAAMQPAVTSPESNSPVLDTEYRIEGQVTPINALQSVAWACDHGDAATLQKLVVFDEAAREKATAFHASLPAELRAQWASLEAMAAAVIISDTLNNPYPVAVILQQAKFEQINPERLLLHLPDTRCDGAVYQQTSDGWKFAITEEMVDDYISKKTSATALKRHQTM